MAEAPAADRRRSRSGARVAVGIVAVLLVLALVVGAITLALRHFVPSTVSGSCRAVASESLEARLSGEQSANAALIAGVARQRNLPVRAATVALATAMQESRLENIDYGDRDSVGLFQQRPSQGWGTVEQIMDPVYATNAFYDGLAQVEGWESMSITEAAQAVQRSAFPDAYADHEEMARAFAANFVGQVEAGMLCRLPGADGSLTAGGSGAVASLSDLARRDLGLETVVLPTGVAQLDATQMPDADQAVHLGWGTASWAAATATLTDAVAVATDGRVWLRSDGGDAAWHVIEGMDEDLLEDEVARLVVDAAREAGPGVVVVG